MLNPHSRIQIFDVSDKTGWKRLKPNPLHLFEDWWKEEADLQPPREEEAAKRACWAICLDHFSEPCLFWNPWSQHSPRSFWKTLALRRGSANIFWKLFCWECRVFTGSFPLWDSHESRQGSGNFLRCTDMLNLSHLPFPRCIWTLVFLWGSSPSWKKNVNQFQEPVRVLMAPTWETDKSKFNRKSTSRAALGMLLNLPDYQFAISDRLIISTFRAPCVHVRWDPCTEASGTCKQFLKWDSLPSSPFAKSHAETSENTLVILKTLLKL